MEKINPWDNGLNPITMLPVHTKKVSKENRARWNETRNKRRADKLNGLN